MRTSDARKQVRRTCLVAEGHREIDKSPLAEKDNTTQRRSRL